MRTRTLPRLHSSLALAILLLAGCRHVTTERERRGAEIHYDLGVHEQQTGDIQGAMRDFQAALALDDSFAEAHFAYALLLHLSFHKDSEAIAHYKRALEIRPSYSEVKVNLANVYLSEDRYDAAIPLYQEALNDMLYNTPYIAQNNLGWALYKKGDVKGALENIRAAVTTNPKFCLGYRDLGIIAEEQGDAKEACRQFAQFRESCPGTPEADFRQGVCLAREGKVGAARDAFSACVKHGEDAASQAECQAQLDRLGPAPQTANP